MDFFANLMLSYLPPRYLRRWRDPQSDAMGRATFWSGILQCAVCLLLYIGGFIQYAPDAWIGPLAWMEYAFTPWAILLLYFSVEGLVRWVTGLVASQSVGTLPLYVVAWGQTALERRRAEAALGERVADKVERGTGTDFDLRIASCRPKPNWNLLMTVSYQDELFEVAKQEEASPPRRFVYLLRRMPEGKVVRGLHHYDPNEALPEK